MGKQIYHKPIWLLFKDFADELSENEVFAPQVAIDWFRKNYPKIKEGSIRDHLVRMTTNNPTRVHYKATKKDDLFFRINSSHLRKYIPKKDPAPIYTKILQQKEPKLKKKVKGPPIETRVDDLIGNFHDYLSHFEKNIKFSGPSIYFHKKVIGKIRNSERYEQLFHDDLFFDYLYATLASWGMHRMGKGGAKMANFEDFKHSICLAKDNLLNLQQIKLELITGEELLKVKTKLSSVFDSIHVMESGSKLVGNSKAVHHLLPDLVPPIDRQHTLRFFYGHTNIYNEEKVIFLECFDKFIYISHFLKHKDIPFEGFNTSIPKIIDNAIMGYAMKKLL